MGPAGPKPQSAPGNPYAAPGALPVRSAEDDIAEAVPPPIARVAGGLVALAGAVVALTGVQTMMIARIRGPFASTPWVLLLLGVPHLLLGAMVFRARAWAALVSIVGTALLALTSGAWLVFSLGHFLFSLYALGSPMAAVAALVLSLVALGPCQRASAARARLREQGMNLGI